MVKFSRLSAPGSFAVPWRAFAAAAAVVLLLLAMVACGSGAAPEPAAPAPTAAGTSSGAAAQQPAATAAAPAADGQEPVTLQVVCINRTLDPCELIRDFYIPRVHERTDDVRIEISSYPELGLAGPDTIRLVNDRTLEFAEIYSGYVGGDLPVIDVGNLWGVSPSNEAHFALSDAIEDDIVGILRRETGGEPVFRAYYPNQYIFSNVLLPDLAAYEGKKIRQHSTVLGKTCSPASAPRASSSPLPMSIPPWNGAYWTPASPAALPATASAGTKLPNTFTAPSSVPSPWPTSPSTAKSGRNCRPRRNRASSKRWARNLTPKTAA